MNTDSTQNGWISYRAFFTPSAGWQTFNLDWSAFALPSWSPNTVSAYPMDTSRMTGINFAPAGAAGSGPLTVDDIRF